MHNSFTYIIIFHGIVLQAVVMDFDIYLIHYLFQSSEFPMICIMLLLFSWWVLEHSASKHHFSSCFAEIFLYIEN